MAKPITITIPHELGREKALDKVRSRFDQVGEALGFGVKLEQEWAGDTLNFQAAAMGQTVTGKVDVTDSQMTIELTLPMLLAGLADKLSTTLGKQARLMLAKD